MRAFASTSTRNSVHLWTRSSNLRASFFASSSIHHLHLTSTSTLTSSRCFHLNSHSHSLSTRHLSSSSFSSSLPSSFLAHRFFSTGRLNSWHSLNSTGLKYLSESKLPEAEKCFIQAMRDEGASSSDSPHVYLSLTNLSTVLRLTKQYKQAISNLHYAIDHSLPFLSLSSPQREMTNTIVGHMYRELGLSYEATENEAAAEKAYSSAQQHYSLAIEELTSSTTATTSSPPTAEQLKQQSEELLRVRKEHVGCVFAVAVMHHKQQHYEQAVQFYQQSLGLAEGVYGKGSVNVAEVWNSLGDLYSEQKDLQKANESWLACMSVYGEKKDERLLVVLKKYMKTMGESDGAMGQALRQLTAEEEALKEGEKKEDKEKGEKK